MDSITPSRACFSKSIQPRLEQIASHIEATHHHDFVLSFDGLQDALVALFSDCKAATTQTPYVSGFVEKFEGTVSKIQTLRINAQDFEVIKTIATGAVGRVCLVVGKSDRKEYAMKVLKKTDLLTRREAGFFMEERNALVFGNHSRWITTLYAAFQDDENLYLVMEYIPGGSLRTFLNAREMTLTEDEARFYVAEMVLALEEVHRLHYIHRDLKPDNVLIDHDGHLKLGDFGSCIRITGDGQKVRSRETVGTPDYISPEILRAQEGNVSYGEEVDLWSLGIILYEMLFDEVPFYSESLVSTYGKIMDHENTLEFPDDVAVSVEAISLMKNLICNPEQRLSLTSIKTHSWFREFSWDKVLELTPPFVPELEGPRDTRYFGEEDLGEAKKTRKQPLPKTRDFAGQNLPFIGYTYVQDGTPCLQFPFHTEAPIRSTGSSVFLLEEKVTLLTNERLLALAELEKAQKEVEKLQSDKKRLESDLRKSQALVAQESSEREELESRLSSVRRSQSQMDGELRRQLRDAEVERDELLERVEGMKATEFDSSALIEKLNDEMSDLKKGKIFLDKEVERLAAKVTEETMSRKSLQIKLEETSQKLEEEKQARVALQSQLNRMTLDAETMEAKFSQLHATLSNEQEKCKTLVATVHDLEHSKVVLESELNSTRLQLQSHSSSDKEETLQQIATLVSQRDNYLSQISTMTKSNAILELEVLDLTDKIAFIQQSLNSTQSQLLVVEKKLSHELAHSVHLEQKVKDMEALLNTETEAHLQDIAKLQDTIDSLKEKNHCLETARESLESDLSATNTKCQNLEDSLSKSTSKSIELSKLLAEERILNTTNESTRQLLDTQLTDLHDRLKTFQRQATSETLRLAEQLSENQESIIPLQTRIATLEQELTASNTLNHTLTSKNQTLESESITLHTRIQDLEGWTLTLQEELDSLKSKTILSTPPTPTPKQPTRHRITSLKTLFARPQAHSLTAEQEPSSIVMSPTHLRKPSDATSLSSHVTRQSDPSLSDLTPLFTPSTPTTGLLKLPKDGKPRHGWRAYTATLDASHFVLSDQRNSGDSTGTVVIDIREADVFRVCSVSQNELIHVSGRVIECVFKVLVGAGRSSVGSEKEVGQSFVEVSKALEDVKGDIGREEAVLSALEKMIGVVGADEGQKHMVCVQIEASRQKLEKLGVEEQRLLGVLESFKSEDPNLSLDQLSDQSFQEDLTQAVSLLQTKLDEEIRKRETLKKLAIVRQNQESASATTPSKGKSIKDEITASEMAIQKLETDLSVLTGTGPRETKKSIVKKVLSSNTTRGGHVFKRRQNYQSHQPMACANCQDALWGNQSLECTRCKIQCHNGCHKSVEVSCSEVSALKEIQPLYFMAESAQDKARWIAALEYFRTESQKGAASSTTGTPRSRSMTSMLQLPSNTNSSVRQVSGVWQSRKSMQSEGSLASFSKGSFKAGQTGGVNGASEWTLFSK